MIGLPVTRAMDRAAPPRASPSSLVSTTPSKPTPSANALAVSTADWPIMASTTNRTSSGLTASRMSRGLLHQFGVDAQPAGGVDDDHVVQPALRLGDRGPGHRDGITHPVPRLGGEDVHPGPLPDDLQLVDRVRTLQVGRHEQRRVALALQPEGELAGQGRLAGALQAGQHHDGGRSLGEPERTGLAAEDADQFVVDDLDDLLGGVQRAGQLEAARALLDVGDEVLDHGQVDVGLEQGAADLPGRLVEIGLGDPALAAQPLERRGEAVLESVEHEDFLRSRCRECGTAYSTARERSVLRVVVRSHSS